MSLPQPFPTADHTRLDRVCQDVADLVLHVGELDRENAEHAEHYRKLDGWVATALRAAANGRSWWFLENLHMTTVGAGADMIDLKGHLDRVVRVYAPKQLHLISLAQMAELRAEAAANNRSNAAGECTHYALEAGRRLHLWPAPSKTIPFQLLYLRPMHIAIVPQDWEPILVDGAIGLRGRHFDREQFAQDPVEFERRFFRELDKAQSNASSDVHIISRWKRTGTAHTTATANSATNTATETLVPASIQGVGYEMLLSTGDYLLVDDGTAPFGQQYYFEVIP